MLIDSHCHLDYPALAGDLDTVLENARAVGIGRLVTISTRIANFERLKTIAETHLPVFSSIGTHPHNADDEPDISADEIIAYTEHEKVVAIGEAGLDYFHKKSSPQNQANGLRAHIEAARRSGLPLVIHSRDADEDMAAILSEESKAAPFPFLMHCFSSGETLAMRALELGGYISFSGILTFKRSDELRAIARKVPKDRLLVETDAPYLAPQPWRGKANQPAYVSHTADVLAETIGVNRKEIREITGENFFKLFSKVPRELPGDDALAMAAAEDILVSV